MTLSIFVFLAPSVGKMEFTRKQKQAVGFRWNTEKALKCITFDNSNSAQYRIQKSYNIMYCMIPFSG